MDLDSLDCLRRVDCLQAYRFVEWCFIRQEAENRGGVSYWMTAGNLFGGDVDLDSLDCFVVGGLLSGLLFC